MNSAVLMVHGLAETSCLMAPMASVLHLAGFEPVLFDFPSTKKRIETLTEEHLGPAIKALGDKPRLDIVTHSMGGVMLRYYLQRHAVPNLGRIVMLGPGHMGSPMLSLYCRNPLYRLVLGPAAVQSTANENAFAFTIPNSVPSEVGVIAGCLPLDPLSLLVMRWPHDGRVPVSSTEVHGMTDHIVLPTSHDLMIVDPLACYQTAHFLKHGAFARGPISW
jgi:triacylglycerol lipase